MLITGRFLPVKTVYLPVDMPVGRPKSAHPSKPVEIQASPKLRLYLDDLIREDGYGTSRPEVARTLVWRGIEELITRDIIQRRPGEVPEFE